MPAASCTRWALHSCAVPTPGTLSTTKGDCSSLKSGADREVADDCRAQSAQSRYRRYRAATGRQQAGCRHNRRHGRDLVQSLLAQRKRPTVLASSRRVGHPSTRFRTAMAVTFLQAQEPMMAMVLETPELCK